jgi:hypothetical protein
MTLTCRFLFLTVGRGRIGTCHESHPRGVISEGGVAVPSPFMGEGIRERVTTKMGQRGDFFTLPLIPSHQGREDLIPFPVM